MNVILIMSFMNLSSKFPLPEGEYDPYEYLRDTCYKGLIDRYDVFEGVK